MNKKKDVRYRYALNQENRLVSIDEARLMDGVFICPQCHTEMIKRCGEHNAKHFAHKSKECDYDHYLHTVAEQRITEWYNTSREVSITILHTISCPTHGQCKIKGQTIDERCYKQVRKKYDLKKWFERAEQERAFFKDGERYIADIFCHNQKNPDNPLFLEICVTHRCEQKKIDSGIKIIEIDICSEADIDAIIGSTIEESENVHFYNFEPKQDTGKPGDFGVSVKKFILWPSMKAFVSKPMSCHDISKRRGVFEITTFYDECIPLFPLDGGFYKVAMAVASEEFPVKDCSLCKYCKYNERENDDICILYKKYGTHNLCRDNDASKCSSFYKYARLIRERIESFKKHGDIDVWKKE